jgi:valyl-tRNA synthetase
MTPRSLTSCWFKGLDLSPAPPAWVKIDVSVTPERTTEPPDRTGRTRLVAGGVQAFISLEGIVDVDAERARLAKAVAETEGLLAASRAKLANDEFVAKAPEAVVAKERVKADELAGRLAKLRAQVEELG